METVGYIPEEKPEDGAKVSAKKAEEKAGEKKPNGNKPQGGNKPQDDAAKAGTADGDSKPAADGKK